MEDKQITISNQNDIYDPAEMMQVVIKEETNKDWLFFRDLINGLRDDKIITENQRFSMLIQIRKELGLTVL